MRKARNTVGRIMVLFTVSIFSVSLVAVSEVQALETTGQVGFTGVYEPIGTPDPAPPDITVKPPTIGNEKPSSLLPQTNDLTESWIGWLGMLIVCVVFILWKRKKRLINKKKVGIIL